MQITKIIIMGFILIFCACKKDEQNPASSEDAKIPPSTAALKKFSCNLNGTLFNTDSADNNPFYIDTLSNFKILVCGGIIDSNFVGFGFTFPGINLSLPTTLMSYPTASVELSRTVAGVYYDNYVAFAASVQITAHDSISHKVSGTFSGTLVEPTIHDTVIITNGKFVGLSYFLVY